MGQKPSAPRFSDFNHVKFIDRWEITPKDNSFPDLKYLPPELGLKILSNVDADDLRHVKGIWEDLANDELLWKRQCFQTWKFCNAYQTPKSEQTPHFWKTLYNTLEAGTAFFNQHLTTESCSGLALLHRLDILNEDSEDVYRFIEGTDLLKIKHVVAVFKQRLEVVDLYVENQSFRGKFLPVAMRSFFFKLSISMRRANTFTSHLLQKFSEQFTYNNPEYAVDAVLIVCYSLLMLSNDLTNPSIKNKMSKREFIKNTIKALSDVAIGPFDSEYLTHSFDNVYLLGHVAPERLTSE